MNKILLIIQREYISRVKKKAFLVVTFLVPVLIMGMSALIIYLAINQGDKKKVEVVDESGWFSGKLKPSKNIEYTFATNYAEAKSTFLKKGYDYLLYVPASITNVQLYGEKTPGAMNTGTVEDDLNTIVRTRRLAEAHIDSAVLANAQKPVKVETKELTEKGEKDTHIGIAQGVGLVCAMLIYLALFLYGAQVMRGVIEEKVSRIIEVIISSVKPFQLMLGKIIGVGMVGLTQFVIWITLSVLLTTFALPALMGSAAKDSARQAQMQQVTTQTGNVAATGGQSENTMEWFMHSLQSLPAFEIIGCFLFYFLFGYLLYSALFAAVGSAVDNETETQQFMIPVTLPLLFTLYVSQTVIVNNPDSALSVWLSLIPFTSPIAMMARIPFGVPAWQIALSMVLMIIGFLFTTWVAARIYRIGILMYGKKASYKELAKWFMYKD